MRAVQSQTKTDASIHRLKHGLAELEKEINDLLDSKVELKVANQANQKVFGQQQSPINLITTCQCKHTVLMGDEEYVKNKLSFQYPQLVKNCTILHNGYTVQINIAPSNKCIVNIAGKEFKLVQFHFHTPAEHAVDGQLYDMEMHLVHASEDGELAVLGFIFSTKEKYQRPKLELTKSRAHLVLASGQGNHKKTASKLNIVKVLNEEESDDCETDDEWDGTANENLIKKLNKKSKKANDFLAQFLDQCPRQKTECDTLLKKPISFDYLFECSSDTFVKNVKTNEIDIDMELWTYMGGLTTPPYSEGVNWMVSKRVHFMSEKQLKDLSGCWEGDNNRELQDYCGRQVKLRNKSQMDIV